MESSSRFATYVAFGLFRTAIFVSIIGHAFFIGAILYLAVALETVDIFLNYFLIIHVSLALFFWQTFFQPSNQQVDFQLGAFDPGAVTDA